MMSQFRTLLTLYVHVNIHAGHCWIKVFCKTAWSVMFYDNIVCTKIQLVSSLFSKLVVLCFCLCQHSAKRMFEGKWNTRDSFVDATNSWTLWAMSWLSKISLVDRQHLFTSCLSISMSQLFQMLYMVPFGSSSAMVQNCSVSRSHACPSDMYGINYLQTGPAAVLWIS